MRNRWIFCALVVSLLGMWGTSLAQTLEDTGKAYTLFTKDRVVLQGTKEETDRHISCDVSAAKARQPMEGISSTTGFPLPAENGYMPIMVQVSNATGQAPGLSGKNVQAAGLGKRAPWGAQYADIIYESLLYQTGQTRYTFLFHDELVDGREVHTGPVRSARIGSMILSRAWGGGFVCVGMAGVERQYMEQYGVNERSFVFDLHQNRYHDIKHRIRNVKAPDNYDVNVSGFQKSAWERICPTPCSFRFASTSPYGKDYQTASRIFLDWGEREYLSSFVYDAQTGLYQRFCGDKDGAPWLSFASQEDRETAHMQPLTFRNLIMQRIRYTYLSDQKALPVPQSVGSGNADIFINGRYIPGYWVCEGVDCPTMFFDDQGKEIQLSCGKTYIAQFSPLRLLAFAF